MLLYHFTSIRNLDAIKAEGITRGEVPLSATQTINGVWLTTDPSSAGHGLSSARKLGAEELRALEQINGRSYAGRDIWTENKRAVRMTVKVPSTDTALKDWLKWSRKRIASDWLEALHSSGGGVRKAKTWFVLFRPVTPDEIVAIEILDAPLTSSDEQP